MPKYAVEREWLLPVFQRVIIDAKNPAHACRLALTEEPNVAPETSHLDWNGATDMYIAALVRSDDIAALGDRDEREEDEPPPSVPEQHLGGLYMVNRVTEELTERMDVLMQEDAPPEDIARLRRWRSMLVRVAIREVK
jgi:hypothetical protein